MIHLDHVGVRYDGAGAPALTTPDLRIGEGEMVLVIGPTGSGKSTLLNAINGLVPHFTGGHLTGRVVVDGRDTSRYRPRDLADVVGLVQQNPAASFVTDTVEDEIAYGMETLSVAPTVMRRRVEETLDLLGLASIRRRRLHELSGGQQQRVAIAAVLAAGPHVLVLDEPTSALDPVAAEEVLSSLHRLVHDLGLTVVLAEHRLERVIHHADRIVLVSEGQASGLLLPAEAMARSSVYPPVIALGRLAGWTPLPLSVREARRAAGPIRDRLAPLLLAADAADAAQGDLDTADADRSPARPTGAWLRRLRASVAGAGTAAGIGSSARSGPQVGAPPVARLDRICLDRGGERVLHDVSLVAGPGEIVAVMGRNGAGKSTLLWALAGQLPLISGRVHLLRHGEPPVDPAALPPRDRVRRVGLVPQDPDDLLYADEVGAECSQADADAHVAQGTTYALLTRLAGEVDVARHPRDLSEGQRLALAIAVVLASSPPLLLLDEPTRGLDYPAKRRLRQILTELAATGTCVVMATHDVELTAETATRVVLISDGELVADDPSPQVLAGSTAYAPQVARVLHPVPLITVDGVREALAAIPEEVP